MPRVLTTKASIRCPHGGDGTSVPSNPKWEVNGFPVLLDGDGGILSCINIPPCTSYQLRSMKLNATEVDGRHVMLVTDFTQSITGFPLTITDRHDVFDESTPVPIPTSGPIPPTPAKLQEIDQPTVVATPPTLVFSRVEFAKTHTPHVLPMTFTLGSQFPRQWILSMISKSGLHRDITQGDPPAIVVTPAGGDWSQPVLSIEVKLAGDYLATLAPDVYYFVLTAVNFRGKSQFGQVEMTVS